MLQPAYHLQHVVGQGGHVYQSTTCQKAGISRGVTAVRRAEPGSSQGVSGSPLRRELRETMKRPCAQSCQGLQKAPDYGFISQLPSSGCARHH